MENGDPFENVPSEKVSVECVCSSEPLSVREISESLVRKLRRCPFASNCFRSIVTLLLLLATSCHAVRDANAPWGENPPREFDMYWKDPSNVLEDLDTFSSLYIQFVGCIWSEYGIDNFDDDGENRDGDENWYQGRTTTFRANAAYSLYGIKRGQTRIKKCSKATYINSFITNMGADTLLNVLGRNNYDDTGYGHAYCYEVNQDNRDRDLASGDSISTTMGCSLTGDTFVMAKFQGSYCEGQYFLNTTDTMNTYNKAMKKVTCEKVWDYNKGYKKGERVETAADTLLAASSACSNYMYNGRCPDPYGIGRRYKAAIARQGGMSVQRKIQVTSWIAFLLGLGLMAVAAYVKNQTRIHRGEYDQDTCTTEEDSCSSSPKRNNKKKRLKSESPRSPRSFWQRGEVV